MHGDVVHREVHVMRYLVSTTALCGVSIEVEADDREHAREVAAAAPREDWRVHDLCLEGVDLFDDEADVDVESCE